MSMNAISINSVSRLFNLSWLTGPLFDKELRVSSRRRRNYVLRSMYVISLTLFIAIVWMDVVYLYGSMTMQKALMAVAGKTIITTIVWFQFIATQLIAVIILSNSISDEIYHRTLGILMTTPINSFQIVMGKLFSKLLHIVLLLAVSVPLLAVVRVFGGVPWNYILSSLCITITAVIFAGALSLNFSISNRRTYVVIIKTIVTLGILYIFIPALAGALLLPPRWFFVPVFGNPVSQFRELIALLYFNPFGAMSIITTTMLSPMRGLPFFFWPLHCGMMLAASALLIARSVKVVRKVALRQAVGSTELIPKFRFRREKNKNSLTSNESSGIIKQVTGLPVLWKELRAPMIQGRDGRNSKIGLGIAVVALVITYAVFSGHRYLGEDFAHVMYALMFVVMGSIFNMVLSATCITSEKESSSWPILMATSMDDWHIVLGKAAGVFYKCLPIWLLFAGHVLIFVLIRYIHPIAILHVPIFIVGLSVFLTGLGLYCSACFKRTTWAVVSNFAFALVFWAIIPVVLGMFAVITRKVQLADFYVNANPLVQISVLMNGAGGVSNARTLLSGLRYDWPIGISDKSVTSTTGILFLYMLFYVLAGLFFAWRAKCRFRRNIF
jgi:ABC-2 type transport system permease protein